MDYPEKLASYGTQDEDKNQYPKTNTNNVNETWALLQTTGYILHKNSMHKIKYAITFQFDHGDDYINIPAAISGLRYLSNRQFF